MGNKTKKLTARVTSYVERNFTDIKDFAHLSSHDFAWKVRWRMKHDRNPLFVQVQDKYKVKEYAQRRGVPTADVYYETDTPETIPFEQLPSQCFIKANHGCGWNILFKNGKFYNYKNSEDLLHRDAFKQVLTRDECIALCKTWLETCYSKCQWAYEQIQPKIIVEEKLEPRDGVALIDYRCFVFDGVLKVVNQDSPNYDKKTNVFVDAAWKPFDLPDHYEKLPQPFPQKPEMFSEIVRVAELLGKGLDFVRVDLFDTTKGIVLSEMTIYPEGGEENTPTTDKNFNKWLGDQWKLPIGFV